MAMSTEDRVAAQQAKTELAAATAANGGVDPSLTAQYGITDPDLAKYLGMASMPATIAWGDPSAGGSRSQEQAAARTATQFAKAGGQAELDRITAKIKADPTLQSQLNAVIAAGNKGDLFSKVGDAFVSAVPTVLKLAVLAAGVDLVAGGTLIAAGGSGATAAGATGAAEATAAASAAGESGLALGYGELGTAATGAASTGGAFVGTSGALGATGNAIIDGAANAGIAAEGGIAASGVGAATGAPTLGSLSLTDAAINAGLTNTIGGTGLATTAAVDAGIAAAGTVAPFGGAFVGTNGIIGTTGNAIIDGAANSALSSVTRNTVANVLTGNDPFANTVDAALGGAAFGGVSAAIPDNLNITGNALVDSSLSGAVNSALPAGAAALATGGDVGNALIGGGLIGAGTPLVNAGVNLVAPQNEVPRINSMLNSTAQGSLVGGVSAGVGGGNIVNGMVVGGMGGFGGNLAGQAVDYLSNGSMGTGTIGNTLAQTAGTVAGQVIGNNLAPSGVTIPAASPVYTNFVQPGTMSTVDSMLNPNYSGGLINNYQSLAVQRANQARI